VFRIYDTRTGKVVEIGTGPGGLLRLFTGVPARGRPTQVGSLRPLLVADLIRRNAEHRHGLTVVASVVIAGTGNESGTPAPDGAPDAGATALNIGPAEASEVAGPPGGEVGPGEIIAEAQPGPAAGVTVRHLVRVGPVTFEDRGAGADEAPEVRLSALAENGLDPLAARLALMSFRHAEQATLNWDVLAEADRTLRRWRERVAGWAESPSRPMCAEVTAQVSAAFDADLDTPAALRALRGLEQDPEIPAGSKFESFLHADQLLALDLPREIGRPPRG
jgi:hypothetical protein